METDDLFGLLPYITPLGKFKDSKGADLFFVDWLDFTRVQNVDRGQQIGRHLQKLTAFLPRVHNQFA